MILNLLYTRLKTDARQLKKPGKLIGSIFFVFMAWFYGWGVAQIYSAVTESAEQLVLYRTIETMIITTIFGVTMLRMVLPTYQPFKQLFPKHYPISPLQSYHASIINDMYRKHAVYFLLFLTINLCYTGNISFYAMGLSAYFGATLLRRSLQYLIDFRLKKQAYLPTVIVYCSIAVPFIINNSFIQPWYVLVVILLLLYAIGFYQNSSIIGYKQHNGTYLQLGNSFKLLFNNPKARNPLIYGLILKTVFLLADYYMAKTNNKHLFDGQFVFWLFASPAILFTYVFNNTWGFWRSVWLNAELRIGTYSSMIRQSLKMMLIPLFLDVIITIPILLFTRDDYHFSLPFYFTLFLFLPMQSFMWSLFSAKSVQAKVGMKSRPSLWSSITTILSLMLLTTLQINYWFYILIPFYLLAGFISYYLSKSIYTEKKYKLAEVLLKG